MDKNTASKYIRENFEPTDRLAIVLLNKGSGQVIQRLADADKIASESFQAWLRHQNAQRFEVYVSMNTLSAEARGRTKDDIETVRHVYLDFDTNGTAAVEALVRRTDVPPPNYVINSSPDKWQAIWKVTGFEKDQAETLQRGLARETGADIAATDSARVMRLPGFYNHKYADPHYVRYEQRSTETNTPDRFPQYASDDRSTRSTIAPHENTSGAKSQSESDWAYARRALARGEPESAVISTIEKFREGDKHNAHYYAELTVRKAAASLALTDETRPR
jgi:hypothetical protein